MLNWDSPPNVLTLKNIWNLHTLSYSYRYLHIIGLEFKRTWRNNGKSYSYETSTIAPLKSHHCRNLSFLTFIAKSHISKKICKKFAPPQSIKTKPNEIRKICYSLRNWVCTTLILWTWTNSANQSSRRWIETTYNLHQIISS